MATIGKREDAIKVRRGVGGKAYPKDFNWTCNVCGTADNRSWAEFCQECEHRARTH